MRPEQNGSYFACDTFCCIFLIEIYCILFIQISLKFVPSGPIDNKSAMVQEMTWHPTGYESFTKSMMTQFTDGIISKLYCWRVYPGLNAVIGVICCEKRHNFDIATALSIINELIGINNYDPSKGLILSYFRLHWSHHLSQQADNYRLFHSLLAQP